MGSLLTNENKSRFVAINHDSRILRTGVMSRFQLKIHFFEVVMNRDLCECFVFFCDVMVHDKYHVTVRENVAFFVFVVP